MAKTIRVEMFLHIFLKQYFFVTVYFILLFKQHGMKGKRKQHTSEETEECMGYCRRLYECCVGGASKQKTLSITVVMKL